MLKQVGTINFDKGLVDVTDPSYKQDVWCRKTIPVVSGVYKVIVEYVNHDHWGKRINSLTIQLSRKIIRSEWKLLEEKIGVDSALCGFYQDKPDEVMEWLYDVMVKSKYPRMLLDKDGSIQGFKGVTVSSGLGDGVYKLYARYNKNQDIVGLMLDFDVVNYGEKLRGAK